MAPKRKRSTKTPPANRPSKRASTANTTTSQQLSQPSYWNMLPYEIKQQVVEDKFDDSLYHRPPLMQFMRGRSAFDRTLRGLSNLEGGSWAVLQWPLEQLHRRIFQEHITLQLNRQVPNNTVSTSDYTDRWGNYLSFVAGTPDVKECRMLYLQLMDRTILTFLSQARQLSKIEKTLKQELQKRSAGRTSPSEGLMDAWEAVEDDLNSKA